MMNNNNFNQGFNQGNFNQMNGGLNFTQGVNNNMNFGGNNMNNQFNQQQPQRPQFTGGKNNNQQQNQNKEKLTLTLDPLEFDGTLKTKMTTTVDIARAINDVMNATFSDYHGCTLLNDNAGQLYLSFYFKPTTQEDDRYKATKLLVGTKQDMRGSGLAQRINNMNLRFVNKNCELTQDAKEMLSDFVYSPNGKINWGRIATEQTINEYGNYSVLLRVEGIDINRFIKRIYGSKTKDKKERLDYQINLIKPIGMQGTGQQSNWLVNIVQLNQMEVQKLLAKVGSIPNTGSLPIIR